MKRIITSLLFSFLISVIVTVLLLFITSLLLYYTNISGTITGILITVTYALSPFVGALVLGKRMKEKRFLWGLVLGSLYFIVFLIVSISTSLGNGISVRDCLKVLLAALPGGILGGMFS